MGKIRNAITKFMTAVRQWKERRKLKYTDFSIISNNCWAATAIYQPLGLKYNTPTVGLFIMDEDYIRMLENLDYFLNADLQFILPEDSRYYNKISHGGTKMVTYPIARLDGDIEIHFLHYHDEEEAREKWQRRCKRINRKRIIIKMSLRDSGYDKELMVNRFLDLPFVNKICFVPKDVAISNPELIQVPELTQLNLVGGDETDYTLRRINVYKLLNNLIT